MHAELERREELGLSRRRVVLFHLTMISPGRKSQLASSSIPRRAPAG